MHRRILAFLALVLFAAPLAAQGRCDLSQVPGAVWWGTETTMTFDRLASYGAPIIWFSPDEPNLDGRTGAAINIPEQLLLPGVDTMPLDHPVMYYQVEEMYRLLAIAKPGLADRMHQVVDDVDGSGRGERRAHRRRIVGIQGDPGDLVMPAEAREPTGIARGGDDLVPVLEQLRGEPRADIAGGAGYQNSH